MLFSTWAVSIIATQGPSIESDERDIVISGSNVRMNLGLSASVDMLQLSAQVSTLTETMVSSPLLTKSSLLA